MHESQLNDKIKYCQYNFKKNKKNEAKQCVKKTPQKKKNTAKSMHMSNGINSILHIVDKLKLYQLHLNESGGTSKRQNQTHTKKEKELKKVSCKESQLKSKNSKSISLQGTMKIAKNIVSKLRVEAGNLSKSKSKSKSKEKSKSKLIKPKKSKQIKIVKEFKEEPSLKTQRKSPFPKVTKKKKKQSPSPNKSYSIKLQSPKLKQNYQIETRWPQTECLKTQKSRFQTQSSRFILWEQHEEVRYNKKRKHMKTLHTYLKSFSTFLKYSKQVKHSTKASARNTHTAFNLETMIKSQEHKLLQLRAELGRLKDSNNLNQSLQIIISKVNENISSLKKIQYSQKLEQGQGIITLKSPHNSTRSINQNQKSFVSDAPQVREPILMMDSLMISQDEISHSESVKNEAEKRQTSIKQDSSICLLDSKFLNVTLNNHSRIDENQLSTTKPNLSILKSPESMLLTFDNPHSDFLETSLKSQSKLLSQTSQAKEINHTIQFTVNEVKYFPVEQRSGQGQPLDSYEVADPQSNNTLLSSINNILNSKAVKIQVQQKEEGKPCHNRAYASEEKSYICSLILDELILQFVSFMGSHQFLLQRLIEVYSSIEHFQFPQENTISISIKYDNAYLLELTDHLLSHAASNDCLFERLRIPLGVESFINMRLLRISLIDEYCLDGFEPYNEEAYEEEIDREMAAVQQKSDILTKEQLDTFDLMLGDQEIPEQIILNRCLYQAINNILDNFRPFGTIGLPAFYFESREFHLPPLEVIKQKVANQLQRYINLRLGQNFQQNRPAIQSETILRDTLILHNRVLRDQIQEDFKTQDEDSMQRYQLMLMIENYILSQESFLITQLLNKK